MNRVLLEGGRAHRISPHSQTYTEDGTNHQFDYAYNTLGAPDSLRYPTSTSGVRFKLKYLCGLQARNGHEH
jgi:hypothetical protein